MPCNALLALIAVMLPCPGIEGNKRITFTAGLQITPFCFQRGPDSLVVLYSYQEVAIGSSVLASARKKP